jgi:hypothetical protein
LTAALVHAFGTTSLAEAVASVPLSSTPRALSLQFPCPRHHGLCSSTCRFIFLVIPDLATALVYNLLRILAPRASQQHWLLQLSALQAWQQHLSTSTFWHHGLRNSIGCFSFRHYRLGSSTCLRQHFVSAPWASQQRWSLQAPSLRHYGLRSRLSLHFSVTDAARSD